MGRSALVPLHLLLVAVVVVVCATAAAQEDSLRSALSAVDKRQRYLNGYGEEAPAGYGYFDDDNLEFLAAEDKPYYKTPLTERALLEYLQGEDPRKKGITSPFRERIEEDRERQREQFARYLLNTMNAEKDDGVVYGEMIDDFIDKYPKKSRYYYADPVRKRSRYRQPESPSDAFYALSYLPKAGEEELPFYGERTYRKRFPVSKRSDSTKLHKRSPNREQKKTDPKVEKELSNIFGPSHKSENETQPSKANTKEVAPVVTKTEPLEIKKKSVNWSDYFGLDRRKKSEGDLDKEWLMERYHKAVAMTAKRSTEYPLQHFHNHDQPQEKTKKEESEETKIKEIDEKLKNIEDAIVDDALKYTGAHEGTVDSKEIQEVKDRVISRLAAAYSLEKMRRALGEYKLSIAKERNRLKQSGTNKDYLFSEEKRVSVPRKQAVDEEAEKGQTIDNNIKCKGDNCDMQNVRIPTRILDQYQWGIDECPKVRRECSDWTSTEKYGRTFEMACNMYQLCLLCEDNSWFAPALRCNALFLSKAGELCGGEAECQNASQYYLEKLMLLSRSLREFPLDGCNLICPENER